jgi:phosphatidyl-myo-inositol dimannoside synthase
LKLLFTYLTAFKGHGGIEKFNKAFIKALGNLHGYSANVISAYDTEPDTSYTEKSVFKGYSGNILKYIRSTFLIGLTTDILIVGHINLALIGLLAKIGNPGLRLILVAHGIDVWYNLSFIKKLILRKSDLVLAVSNFTKQKLIEVHKVDDHKIKVFPNTLDPFFNFPKHFLKPVYLQQRYQLSSGHPVIFSLCRLSSKEGYKGYDVVIEALPVVLQSMPDTKYIIAGKYDQDEYNRLEGLIKKFGVVGHVILTGFVPDEEITDHYLLGDVFVMPSREEGFGIVYLEAMACGLPVIAGNIDGSVDALDNGNLGTLVNPLCTLEIAEAIISHLKQNMPHEQKLDLQNRVIEKFGFDKFCSRLNQIIEGVAK